MGRSAGSLGQRESPPAQRHCRIRVHRIVVAWLAKLNPLAIAIASFLLAGLRVGLETLQLDLQVPAAFGQIMEGLILLSVLAGSFFSRYRFAPEEKGMTLESLVPLLAGHCSVGHAILYATLARSSLNAPEH